MNQDPYQQEEEYLPTEQEQLQQQQEEESKVKAAAKKMGLGAFGISLLVHIVFILMAIFLFYKWIFPPEKKLDFLPGGGGGGGTGGEKVHKVQQQMRQKMMSSTSVSKRIASTSTTATFALPDASNELQDPGLPMDIGSAELGSGGGSGGGHGTGTGTGTGTGRGPGKGFGEGQLGIGALIPTIMKGRCTDAERLKMVRGAGGTEKVEAAVKQSLKWLKGQQHGDGSWGDGSQPAMTGLVLLCYLGHCETTQSTEYGDNVMKGITYLINVAKRNDGKMASGFGGNHWVYEHAISTYALSEAFTFSKNLQFQIPDLKETVEKAANIIVAGQTSKGGWDYGYKASSARDDLSVSGWQLQALKAAKASGVHIEGLESCTKNAVDWLTGDAYKGEGKFVYAESGPAPAMTAVAALCLQHWGKAKSTHTRAAVDVIEDGLKTRDKPNHKVRNDFAPLYNFRYNGDNADIYAWYYAVQVMRNEGGKEWDATNKAILEDILTAQNSDGSFKMENPGGSNLVHVRSTAAGGARPIYIQCLDTLILEVYYRFLPATSAGASSRSSMFDDLR